MSRSARADVPVLPVVVVIGLLALVAGLVNLLVNGSGGSTPVSTAITIAQLDRGRTIPNGFLGLSLEYPAVEAYAGSNPAALDPVFVRLVRQLTDGRGAVLRVGGDSADWTWWPVAGTARPPGVRYTLTDGWLHVTRALAGALDAKLVLGLNLEADDPALATAEERALSGGLSSTPVLAYQLGNEPELYGAFTWYRTRNGHRVTGRPHGYAFSAFVNDFTRFAGALPGITLAGPTTGGLGWDHYLGQFLGAEPHVKLVTVHRYPLQLCFLPRSSPRYPTVAHLLSPVSSTGLADSFRQQIAIAHARGLALRVDELNTVSCGADRSVSQTFATALWVLDSLFEIARAGADGVNIHTFPGAGYELFSFDRRTGHWRASVAPMYYGLLMFARAVAPGSRLTRVAGDGGGSLKVWSISGPGQRVRIVLINKSASVARVIRLRAPGLAGPASVERLQAPSLEASAGVTLAGQSFGSSTDTGALQDRPRTASVASVHGFYVVTLPAASAALITATARTSEPTSPPRAEAAPARRSQNQL